MPSVEKDAMMGKTSSQLKMITAWMKDNCHKNIDPATGAIDIEQLAVDAFLVLSEDTGGVIPDIYYAAAFEVATSVEDEE
jgi:hypothetical protein